MKQSDARHEVGASDLGIGAVLYGVLGGPLAWTMHLFSSYFLISVACSTGWKGSGIAVGVVTIVFAGVAAFSAVTAYRRWHKLGGHQRWDAALSDPAGRGGFLWILGMILGTFFAIVILLAGLPPVFVPTCAPV